jgi:Binding-protein-dependent transport system inner membrane component
MVILRLLDPPRQCRFVIAAMQNVHHSRHHAGNLRVFLVVLEEGSVRLTVCAFVSPPSRDRCKHSKLDLGVRVLERTSTGVRPTNGGQVLAERAKTLPLSDEDILGFGCPTELIEASRLEGASQWQIFWRIGMPVMQNGLVTVALLSFVGAWNNFFFPLIVLSQENLYPLNLGLNVWNSVGSVAGGKPVYNLIALGSLISVLPLLTAFIVLGKYWRHGITAGAIEG